MLDYHDRSQTETWSQAPTVAWQASPTMAHRSEPKYAWSAESTGPLAESAPGRWSRLGRPMAFVAAGAGVTAAAAAALAIVFGGATTSTAVATPNASTAIAATPTAPAPTAQAVTTKAATTPRPQAHHGAAASTAAPVSHSASPTPVESIPTQQPSSQPPYQWQDITPRHSNWNFFRPDFDTHEHHDRGLNIQRFLNHHDQSTDDDQ